MFWPQRWYLGLVSRSRSASRIAFGPPGSTGGAALKGTYQAWCASHEKERPTIVASSGKRLVVSLSSANVPAFISVPIISARSLPSLTVRYSRCSSLGAVCVTFLSRLWKPSSRNSVTSACISGSGARSASRPGSSCTSSRIVTRSSESSSSSRSRAMCSFALPLTLSRFWSRFGTEPNSSISLIAPFSPMPVTPGTLSEESPMIASTSITCSGVVPNFSFTAAKLSSTSSSFGLKTL